MESIVVFTVYDSIRCGVENGGYRGSDQGESGGLSQFSGGTGSPQRSTGETLSAKYGFEALVSSRCGQLVRAKKCGAESGDPNLRFQPRLPGSVVGEASMGQAEKADKITGVTVPW